MNDRAPDSALRHPLERHHRSHSRALLIRHALRAAAVAAAAIVVAVMLGAALALGVGGSWMRTALVGVAFVLAVAVGVIRFRGALLSLDGYLELVERRFPKVRSWLRNAIDLGRHPAPHTSKELAGALAGETERRVADVPLATLRPPIGARQPLLAMVGAIALLVLVALVWPAQINRSWATLWNPAAAAPPVRLEVEPGSVTVTPGASLAVRARVWGTSSAPRIERSGGAAVEAVAEGIERDGRVWRFDLTQLTRAQDYRVRVATARSPRYRIDLSGEPAPVGFEIEYHAPAYARLPVQRGAAARGDLTALKGTRARLVVTFDRDLESLTARLPDGRTATWTEITPRRWRGEVTIDRDGDYELRAEGDRRSGEGRGSFRYRTSAIPDAPPLLVVRIPIGDIDLPAGQVVPVDVLAQDDLGLSELRLQFRKDPAAPWTDLSLGRFGTRPREARVESRWDASPIALMPGEVATFRFELFDDNAVSGRGRAVSQTFELRFPSLADLYERVDDRQSTAQTALEKAAEQTRELQKTLDKLSRQQPRAGTESSQSFERSEEIKRAMEQQQQIGQQVSDATQQLRESLEQAAERQAFDEQLMRKMREMQELMQQIQSQEFKEAMRKMQEALEKLDRREQDQNLPEWKRENQEMLSNLERTIELLKKLREEEKLQSLAQRAQELKAQQDALNREHQSDSAQRDEAERKGEEKGLSEQQDRAAEESKQLAAEAREASGESQNPKSKEDLQEAAEEMSESAAPEQESAADAARQGQKSKASESGKKASESLKRAADRLSALAQQSQTQQSAADLAAVRRAAQDLVSLQRSTEQNMSSNGTPREKADRQTDLSEGTARVADSLFNLAKETPFLSPSIAEALGRAINGLSQSGRDMAAGNRARGEQAGRVGSESLNEAVLKLREAEGQMCEKPGMGRPGGQSNPRRLGQLGQRQGQLNRDSRTVAQRLSQQMRLSAGDRDQLQRMADEQARIRQQLEEIRRDEEQHRELLGKLDQAQREMKEVEEVMRGGGSEGELEQKQQRILSRLLDAQRSINRRDFDPQRESRPGETIVRSGPGELAPELLRENDRLRLDLLKADADRYPAQYRAFVEAYLRSLNGSRR